ncbi:TspO/MBR family protein [Salinicoccus hispanicus]|uniref:Tryptophan-rich sensory protein n=1 Tax=Salinicoccus hispanicus TaxID=157225 RepID=A0A6N8U4F6_9STAP|nr:TspO/MBR family protein [Salinicoccus hispanicus]MXQ51355.1 tryptophan-rich sensory protein [Salinicoccus hispanicus]
MKPVIEFIFHLVTPLILGKTVGKLSTRSAPRQYKKLRQPPFAPPRKIFAPMWTFLYLTMGLAHAIVNKKGNRKASRLFRVHLIINYTWSFLFFRLRKRQLALVNSVMIWVTMYAVVSKFFKVSRLSGFILLPYTLWTTFAAYLTLGSWYLNRKK